MTCQMNDQMWYKKITRGKMRIYPVLEKENPKAKMNGHAWELSHSAPTFKLVQQPLRLVFSTNYDLQGDLVYSTECLPYLPQLSL